ncbi:HAMP domain-containing sensor histidine kinase [Dactylosporangium salmoneum]|uniref:histidine kinase n=1 Tax=Dactylosporangium salmoneum TaxID=53361 RepID=A0ABN3HR99_9ACTN
MTDRPPGEPGRTRAAGRSACGLFALAGVLAFAGMVQPGARAGDLLVVAVADLALAAVAWWTPQRGAPLLAVAALVVLAYSAWAFGGVAAGTGPFFVLLFAWVGLHHPPWTAVALAPLTASAYVAPLLATHQPPEVVGSAVVFVPVTTAVGEVIARRVRQLHRARMQVEAAERWRAALMVTLAHDVRAPLTSVQMALEMLDDDPQPEPSDRHRLAASALRQTARITRLAGGLLDAGRIEHGTLRLDRRPVPLRAAAEAAAALTPAAALTFIAVPADLVVDADPDRLEQILVNLIGNAARHGAAPFVVAASADGAAVDLSVRDHGTGVPDDKRAALFERYAPGAGGTPGSVGLGLWIVRELARAHGGDARYEPAEPGARFVVRLPAWSA